MNAETSTVFTGGHAPSEANPLKKRVTRILKTNTPFTIPFEDRFVPDHEELKRMLEEFRSLGCIIAFTTGVWDLFHIGHGDYIEEGKERARREFPDAEHVIMVVGVDTDDLTKARKGPERPIVPEAERVRVLRHLRSVDIITPQYKLNQLFDVVSPDVLIISTSTKDLPPEIEGLKAYCAKLVHLPPQAETSSSARIRRLSIDGSTALLVKIERGLTNLIKEIGDEINKER